MNYLEKYYNKFNENKRLLSRHGQVEFFITTHYIDDEISNKKVKIADIGAGTGRYSFYYADKGNEVTAIEPVMKNLSFIKGKNQRVSAKLGNALNLQLPDNYFDIVILFGPLYHLLTHEEKLQALKEAKRIVKSGGKIFTMYLMNEYAIVTYAIKEGHLQECIKNGKIDNNFQTQTNEEDLYSYVRLEEIEKLTNETDLIQEKIIGVDGPTDYIRQYINKLSDEEFEIYKNYQLSICERKELLGSSSHIMQILKKD